MPFDSLVMTAVTRELQAALAGGRISKIYQPEPKSVVLLIYAGGMNHRLLLSADPRFARLHLTTVERKNPPAPPTFCMLLRKYVEGGRILSVRQEGRDRICHMRIGTTDELGNPAEYTFIVEVMGKHSNMVLVGPHGRIVDAVRRVTEEVNRHRELLPGLPYVAPPPVRKRDPEHLTGEDLLPAASDAPAKPAWELLLDQVDGLGPALAKEVVVRAGYTVTTASGEVDLPALARSTQAVASPDRFDPCLMIDGSGRVKDFHVLPLEQWIGQKTVGFPTVSACLDAFFGRREEEDRVASVRGSLAKLIKDEVGRVRRKHTAQQESLTTSENAETFRIAGELITANLWQLKKGQREAEIVNYYDPDGAMVTVTLDPALGPAENAQAYYRRYQRARSGRESITEQLSRSAAEEAYLEQVEAVLRDAESMPELEEIRRELQSEGYLGHGKRTRPSPQQTNRDDKPLPPLTVQSTDGLEIWIGRNNRQNDYLTLKLAAPNDHWFHTKEIPGAHVILRTPPGKEVPERAVHEAAALAAWYSKGRESSSVPVDFTLRKHVRKPSGARPGMVIYDQQKTLWVTPDPERIEILQRHLQRS